MKANCRYIAVESPDVGAVADFLAEGVTVETTIDGDYVVVVVKVSHGEGASSWDEHEFRERIRPSGGFR